MSKKAFVLLVAGTTLAWTLAAQESFAHATPVEYDPASSAVLDAAPERVSIAFSERVEAGASRIAVFGPDGSAADLGDFRVHADDPHFASVGLRAPARGTYAVSWQVVSADDGHFTKGAYTFSIGEATQTNAPSSFAVVLPKTTWSETFSISLELFGESLFIGILAALVLFQFVRARFPAISSEEMRFRRVAAFLTIASVLLVVAGGTFYVILKTMELLELGEGVLRTFLIFTKTISGSFTLYRMGFALLFFIFFWGMRRRIFESKTPLKTAWLLLAVFMAIAFLRARVSHAAASPFLPAFSVAVNAIHLMFKEFWIGLVGATVVLFSKYLRGGEGVGAFLMRKISAWTAIALAGGGVTGAYIVWLHLKSPANLFASDWGMRFLILAVLAAALLCVRLLNQFVIPETFALRGLALEAVVLLLVLLESSVLIITTPPLSKKAVFEKSASSQGAHIVLGNYAADSVQFLVTIHDNRATKNLVAVLTNEERGIGPIVAKTESVGQNAFVFAKHNLSPPGLWRMELTAQRESGYDAVVSFVVDYPAELTQPESAESKRSFGAFEGILFLGAIGTVALSRKLYVLATRGTAASE